MLGWEYLPILSKFTMTNADMLIYLLTCLNIPDEFPWFPITYVYIKTIDMVEKLKSKSYCSTILPLFGVNSIEDLKKLFKEHPLKELKYPSIFCESTVAFYRDLSNDYIGSIL